MTDQDQHRMALLVHNADLHSEGCSLGYHVPTGGETHVRHRSSEWLEKKGKVTWSGRAAVGVDG